MRRSNTNSYDDPEQHHSDSLLLPKSPLATASKKKPRDASLSYAQRVPGRLLKHSKQKRGSSSNTGKGSKSWTVSTPILIAIWYILGVVSISTSKMLLTEYTNPLILSVQQFAFGQLFLRQMIDNPAAALKTSRGGLLDNRNLLLCGLCFSSGFVLTNMSFFLSSAPAVETVKSAEPITSALIATFGGVDTITLSESGCLALLIFGVLLSTVSGTANALGFNIFGVVMLSNLAFSLRGLYQKRMPKFSSGAHLQYHLQRIGFIVFVPFACLYGCYQLLSIELTFSSSSFLKYIFLCVINSVSFSSYNLASTSILQRLSVVQHAALNSLRRVFAIVVTSLFFDISLTPLKVFGIVISIGSFIAYSNFREKRGVNSISTKRFTGLLPSVMDSTVTRTI